VWREGMSCGKEQKAGGDQGQTEMMWVYKEGSVAQGGKSAVRWHMVRRTGKCSKRGDSQKGVRRIFKMLREVWLNIRMKKIDTHEGIVVKALLDSDATGMFMDKRIRLQKLERLIAIRNVDGTNNSRGAITYQVECNVYYKGHVERIRVYNLEKTKVILGIL